MNSISKLAELGIHPDDLSDLVISRAELEQVTAERRLERARLKRRQRWQMGGLIMALNAMCLMVLGQQLFIWVRPPQTTPEPIWIYQRDGGTVTNYAKWDALPDRVKNDDVVSVITTYVQLRESWSEGNAGYVWRTVSALSSPSVRAQFQFAYARDNPDSPARQYKDGTTVEARYANWTPACPVGGCSGPPDAYRVWFDRYETAPGHEPQNTGRYAVTVRIKRNVPLPSDRLWERWTINAPLIQVVEYPTPQKEGVSR